MWVWETAVRIHKYLLALDPLEPLEPWQEQDPVTSATIPGTQEGGGMAPSVPPPRRWMPTRSIVALLVALLVAMLVALLVALRIILAARQFPCPPAGRGRSKLPPPRYAPHTVACSTIPSNLT